MQLPRGTFREIRKKIVLQDLLFELERTRFSGTCGIVAGPATGSFVFQNGACILARFHGHAGDEGMGELQQSAREAVDVIISTLDETQIKLAIEFNPGCRVLTSPPYAPRDSPVPGPEPVRNIPATRPASPPLRPAGRPGRRVLIRTDIPVPEKPAGPELTVPCLPSHLPEEKPSPEKTMAPADNEAEDFENDIDALDSMDLDRVTSRIRSDCKNLVRHLELDHLIER